MSKFKIGDKVRYIDDLEYSELNNHDVYIVSGLREKGVELKGRYCNDWWSDDRFELVEEENSDTTKTSVKTTIEVKIDLGTTGGTYQLTKNEAKQLLNQLKEELSE